MVVAVSSTANARRGAPVRPALTAGEFGPATPVRTLLDVGEARPDVLAVGEIRSATSGFTARDGRPAYARGRAPRAWASALQRPAAKILVAGGLTLAGWLLTGALTGSTASAAETAHCPRPSTSTVEHGGPGSGHHRKIHSESGAARCASQQKSGDDATAQPDESEPAGGTKAEQPADETKTEQKSTKDTQPTQDTQPTEEPSATKQTEKPAAKATSQSNGLLGGLVGSVLKVVGGTLQAVTSTVGAVTDTLSHTVLAPLTQPPAGHPDAPVLLPLDDILDPILHGGSSSGGVTATLPATVTSPVAAVTTPAVSSSAAAPAAAPQQQAIRIAVVHLAEQQNPLPAKPEQPRDSGVHATGGGDSTPGLPGGTTAPSAPAPSAAPGHDGPGGARHQFAVHTDDVTTTQLKLIGASRDHDVDGAGREAALPTTSPD